MSESAERLLEIKEEIESLMDEAKRIIRNSGDKFAWEQARGYWYAHILTSLDKNSEFLGSSMCTMQDTIDRLDYENDEEEENEEE
jgi:hypothetical protein